MMKVKFCFSKLYFQFLFDFKIILIFKSNEFVFQKPYFVFNLCQNDFKDFWFKRFNFIKIVFIKIEFSKLLVLKIILFYKIFFSKNFVLENFRVFRMLF